MQGRPIERLLLLCFLASCVDLEGSKLVSVVVIRCPPPTPQDIIILFDAFQEITNGWGWKMLLPLPNDLTYQSGGSSCNETWLASTIHEAVIGKEVDAVLTSSPSRVCAMAPSLAPPAKTLFFTSACPEDVSPFGTSVALLATAEAVAHLTRRYNWRSVILLYSDSSWWSSLADRIQAALIDILPTTSIFRLPVDDYDDEESPNWRSTPSIPLALFQQKAVDVIVVCGSHLLPRLPKGLPPEAEVLVTRVDQMQMDTLTGIGLLLLFDRPCINRTQALRCWLSRSLEAAKAALEPGSASVSDSTSPPPDYRRPHSLYRVIDECGTRSCHAQHRQLKEVYSFDTAFRTGGDGLKAGKATSLAGREFKIGALYVSIYALVAASGIGFFAVCLWLSLKKKNDD